MKLPAQVIQNLIIGLDLERLFDTCVEEREPLLVKRLWLDCPDIPFDDLILHPSLRAHKEDLARWHRAFQSALNDLERAARRRVSRLAGRAPPGNIELSFDRWTLAPQAAEFADRYVASYNALIDGGYWCDKDRTDDVKKFL